MGGIDLVCVFFLFFIFLIDLVLVGVYEIIVVFWVMWFVGFEMGRCEVLLVCWIGLGWGVELLVGLRGIFVMVWIFCGCRVWVGVIGGIGLVVVVVLEEMLGFIGSLFLFLYFWFVLEMVLLWFELFMLVLVCLGFMRDILFVLVVRVVFFFVGVMFLRIGVLILVLELIVFLLIFMVLDWLSILFLKKLFLGFRLGVVRFLFVDVFFFLFVLCDIDNGELVLLFVFIGLGFVV